MELNIGDTFIEMCTESMRNDPHVSNEDCAQIPEETLKKLKKFQPQFAAEIGVQWHPMVIRNDDELEEKLSKEKDQEMKMNSFSIDDITFMDDVKERTKCDGCLRSRKFYCYRCLAPMDSIKHKIPRLKLPVDIKIIKHPQEIEGKSTAIHAAILAPESVSIHTHPDLPKDLCPDTSVLVFPSEDAQDISDHLLNNVNDIHQVVFIDSTWNQVNRLLNDPKLKRLPKVKISCRNSLFWRYQRGNPSTYLATIEAIYYFCLEYHQQMEKMNLENRYDGQYDNLLFFFKYMFYKIRNLYGAETLKAYRQRESETA